MKLKVCGLSKKIEVEACIDGNVNFCGFILNYPKSHRHISFDKAKILTKIEKRKSNFVGVLVKPNEKELDLFSKLNFDYFQIYGNYTSKELSYIKKKYKKKIIGVVQVKTKEDIDKYKLIEHGSDIILWDSSGYEQSLSWNFDWIKSVPKDIEKMVAGNLTINKLQELNDLTDIVDVSGALETNKVKDLNKIKKIINKIKEIKNEN